MRYHVDDVQHEALDDCVYRSGSTRNTSNINILSSTDPRNDPRRVPIYIQSIFPRRPRRQPLRQKVLYSLLFITLRTNRHPLLSGRKQHVQTRSCQICRLHTRSQSRQIRFTDADHLPQIANDHQRRYRFESLRRSSTPAPLAYRPGYSSNFVHWAEECFL